jgi:hypothetical protein
VVKGSGHHANPTSGTSPNQKFHQDSTRPSRQGPLGPLPPRRRKRKTKRTKQVCRKTKGVQRRHAPASLAGTLGSLPGPPPICNRVSSPWGQSPFECHCDLWPMWMQNSPPSATTPLSTVQCNDRSCITKEPSQGATCSYWRPGLNSGKERGYYNGVVHQLFRVNRPDGTTTIILAVN